MNVEQKIQQLVPVLADSNLSFAQGSGNAEDEATLIVLKGMGIDVQHVLDGREDIWTRTVEPDQHDAIDGLLKQRISTGIPWSYLVKEAWFAGNRFYVDERALIPRSYLGEWIADRFEPWVESENVHSILDLCTGSGCIAVSCALAFPEASVVASDIDSDALCVAQINIQKYHMQGRIKLNQGDGFERLSGRFDLIVCNPPYVSDQRMDRLPPEFLREPDKAFRGGLDGLDFIVPLLQQARHYLTDKGVLIVEAGSSSHALEARFPDFPFVWLSTEFDEMVVFIVTAAELEHFQNRS